MAFCTKISPPAAGTTTATREEGERETPSVGRILLFSMEQRKWELGRHNINTGETSGPLYFAHGRGGWPVQSGTTWGCEEEDGKEDYCNIFSQSSHRNTLVCAPLPQNRPWVLLQRRDAGPSTICALRCIASLSRGRASNEAWASEPPFCLVCGGGGAGEDVEDVQISPGEAKDMRALVVMGRRRRPDDGHPQVKGTVRAHGFAQVD